MNHFEPLAPGLRCRCIRWRDGQPCCLRRPGADQAPQLSPLVGDGAEATEADMASSVLPSAE